MRPSIWHHPQLTRVIEHPIRLPCGCSSAVPVSVSHCWVTREWQRACGVETRQFVDRDVTDTTVPDSVGYGVLRTYRMWGSPSSLSTKDFLSSATPDWNMVRALQACLPCWARMGSTPSFRKHYCRSGRAQTIGSLVGMPIARARRRDRRCSALRFSTNQVS